MPKGNIFMNRSSDQLGVMSFELDYIYSSGGPDFPLLSLRTDISLRPFIDHSQAKPTLHILSLVRAIGQLRSPQNRVVARFAEDIAQISANPNQVSTQQVVFEIPLDLAAVTRIEQRRAGENLEMQLAFQLLFALHSATGGFEGFHLGHVDGLTFSIPRSQWIDKILPGLGYGGLEIIEVRYGLGIIARELPKSVQEIQEAKKSLIEGHPEKAAAHCRKAIELIMESRPSSMPPTAKFRERVNAFVNDNFATLDDRHRKLLVGQMELIWEVSSQTVHPSSASPFTRSDAGFLIRATMAIVEYFSRLLS